MFNNIKNIIYKKCIYVVSTPIGNIFDITIRALNILKNVDLIISEDTRKIIKILNFFSIKNNIISFNSYNEKKKIKYILNFIKNDKNIALVSDSGTPTISDPGKFLINNAIKEKFLVLSIPGPCSVISAISISGIISSKFCYEGFIPKIFSKRNKLFHSLLKEKRPIIFHESPKRLIKTLEDMINVFGNDKIIFLIKEITKIHEKYIKDNLKNILYILKYKNNFILKGEITIVLEGFN